MNSLFCSSIAIFFLALSSCFSPLAYATTFAPTPATKQIENAEYIIQGQVTNIEVRSEPQSNQPHTYYDIRIEQTLKGRDLNGIVTVRQAGGELGNIGYRVAGAAEIKLDEDVVLTVRESNEQGIYQLLSLAMGKYSLEKEGGLRYLKNGLGFYLRGADGNKLTLENFKNLVDRVARAKITDNDRKIILTPQKHTVYRSFTPEKPEKSVIFQADKVQPPTPKKNTVKFQKQGNEADKPHVASTSEQKWPLSVKFILAAFGCLFVILLLLLFRGN